MQHELPVTTPAPTVGFRRPGLVLAVVMVLSVPRLAAASDMCALTLFFTMPAFAVLGVVSLATTALTGPIPPRVANGLHAVAAVGALLLVLSGSGGVLTHFDLAMYTFGACFAVLGLAGAGAWRAAAVARVEG